VVADMVRINAVSVGISLRLSDGEFATKRTDMATEKSGPEAGAEGIIEDVKGKTKEVIGKVTGNEDLEREGNSQQSKAEADREVAKREAQAESARGEAQLHEAEERVHQRAKND
jgi:uncharacterized protein YjbJ (UPF0337 family)